MAWYGWLLSMAVVLALWLGYVMGNVACHDSAEFGDRLGIRLTKWCVGAEFGLLTLWLISEMTKGGGA